MINIAGAGGITRVTSDPAATVATGIAAITSAAATAGPATGREGTAPRGEGRTTASVLSPLLVVTHCRLGLHSSYIGGGAMLSLASIWPLSESTGQSRMKNSNYEIEKKQRMHTRMQAAGL